MTASDGGHVLAYVFFHRPAPDVGVGVYERGLAAFHRSLGTASASFRLEALPFGDGGPGYEDWYLVDDWSALGEIGAVALAPQRRREHDAVAARSGEGWGGVWALRYGDPVPPPGVRWASKPRGRTDDAFLAAEDASTVWQRQLVLGPAPEFAFAAPPSPARVQVA
jgi:hypothetical protein